MNKAYKILTKDMTSPYDNETKWELGKSTKVSDSQELKIAGYGLHLYKSLDTVSIGKFGSRVFEAEVVGEHIEDEDKLCAYEVKLTKELKPEDITDSQWAYHYCVNVKDRPRVRKNIKNPKWSYHYCISVEDRHEVRKYIKDSMWAYWYCANIKDRPEVRKNIKDL